MGKSTFLFYLLFPLFLCLIFIEGNAQNYFKNQYKDRYYSVSLGTGQNGYFGELNENNNIRRGLRNLTASLEARLLDKISARAEFSYFTIGDSDSNAPDSTFERQRNLSFESRNFEANLQVLFYLHNYSKSFGRRKTWEPYLTLGIGVTRFNPTAILNDEKISLRDIQTENVSYGNFALVVPAGIGVKARLTKYLNVIFEAGYRYTFTDYLDDVSTVFPQFQDNTIQQMLSNRKGEIGVVNREAFDQLIPGGNRGNPDTNDSYLLINLKLEFYIPLLTRGK